MRKGQLPGRQMNKEHGGGSNHPGNAANPSHKDWKLTIGFSSGEVISDFASGSFGGVEKEQNKTGLGLLTRK